MRLPGASDAADRGVTGAPCQSRTRNIACASVPPFRIGTVPVQENGDRLVLFVEGDVAVREMQTSTAILENEFFDFIIKC